MQQHNQRLKEQQQQALMQQAALLQQQSLYHPGLLAAAPQIEPIPSGNLPPGFDPSTCRSVYVGNIHTQVTEPLLQEVFSSTGPIEGCKLVRKEKSSYGFIHYFDRRSAAVAILSLNGRHLFGQPIKVNWAYASGQREDTSSHYNIFVGDLSSEVTDAMLFACFSVYPSCSIELISLVSLVGTYFHCVLLYSDARVMWDQKTGRSRGFGFVSFRNQQEAQSAINDLTGRWVIIEDDSLTIVELGRWVIIEDDSLTIVESGRWVIIEDDSLTIVESGRWVIIEDDSLTIVDLGRWVIIEDDSLTIVESGRWVIIEDDSLTIVESGRWVIIEDDSGTIVEFGTVGKWLGSRQIRCNWATKGAGANDDKQSSDAKSVVELSNGSSEDGKETANNDGPENNPQPQYTTVYVGNLAPEAGTPLYASIILSRHLIHLRQVSCFWHGRVSQLDLHRHFHALGAGVIEEVRIQRDKGFGFVRYSTHAEAALAIQMGNTQSMFYGKQIKCSWGSKPTPPGTSSNPLPPPVAAPMPGFSASDVLAYERQLAMAKIGGGVHPLMHPQGQHHHLLKQAAMGMGSAGASQAIYDGGFQNVAAAQQLMYYQ
ncbi:hypothetical protein RHGRI_035409 [Rhododendron griersonianum]|uniref:RRM domain-containing protein n=1 Tax=Rhododendron griersonianum TaxID=479676 RepID=A0AAV6I594_9ERIC|nr:hypothetical protein RHGRI_035409 [Rhododendron griersonianum]